MPLAIAACGSTKFVPKTEIVVLKTDDEITAPVPGCSIDVRTNEDLERKAQRCEAALKEANARLADVRASQEQAIAKAKEMANQPAAPWWRRLFGGGK